MENRMAVILAAGKGTRMKSSLYKVLHPPSVWFAYGGPCGASS